VVALLISLSSFARLLFIANLSALDFSLAFPGGLFKPASVSACFF